MLTIVPSEGLDCTNCTRKEEVENGTTLLIVPARLRDRELLPLLEPYSHYRVWRLSFAEVLLLPRAYGGFACKGARREGLLKAVAGACGEETGARSC